MIRGSPSLFLNNPGSEVQQAHFSRRMLTICWLGGAFGADEISSSPYLYMYCKVLSQIYICTARFYLKVISHLIKMSDLMV